MEERKLNFNAPLLSVRRYSTTAVASSNGETGKTNENSTPKRKYTIPFYRTDLNLEQVTEPAAVPFMWERIPGRPKDGASKPQHSGEVSVTPRPLPERASDTVKYPLEKEVEVRPLIESYPLNEYAARLDSLKERNDENSNVEDDDDVYSDALDTLSSTDSVSINCSESGLSGCEGQVVKRSGTFSTDPQTRDFMMSRFLPAAKAMALEPPQYASKKQPVQAVVEQPRQVVKVVPEDRKRLVSESIFIRHYGENIKEEEEEEEEEEESEVDECDDPGNLSYKACGLLPRLCFNKSFNILNPLPGLKVRTHCSMFSSHDVRNLSKAVYTKSHSEIAKKHAWDAVHEHQADGGIQSPKLQGIENKVTCASNRFASSSDQQMVRRSSPFRRGISPYRNERPQSPFRGGGFLGVPKEAEIVRANKLNLYSRPISKSQELFPRRWSGPLSPAVEKTLYVDTVNFAKRSCSNSSSLDTKGQIDSVGKSSHTSMEVVQMETAVSSESSLRYAKCLNDAKGEKISETTLFGSVEANQSSFSDTLHPEGQADMMQCSRLDGDLNQECKALVCIKVAGDEYLKSSSEQKFHMDDPLPPPLPKKPSESWLCRTLPTVSSRNSFSHSNPGSRFNPKKQDPNTPLITTKWETMVKTSYAHHDHMRYSEELTSRFSQQSKHKM